MLSLLSTHMLSPIFLALDDNVMFSYTRKQMKYGYGLLVNNVFFGHMHVWCSNTHFCTPCNEVAKLYVSD